MSYVVRGVAGVLNGIGKAFKGAKTLAGKAFDPDNFRNPFRLSSSDPLIKRSASPSFGPKAKDVLGFEKGDKPVGSFETDLGGGNTQLGHVFQGPDGNYKLFQRNPDGSFTSKSLTENQFNSFRQKVENGSLKNTRFNPYESGNNLTKLSSGAIDTAVFGGVPAAVTGYYLMSPSQEENLAENRAGRAAESAISEDVSPNNTNSGKDEEKAVEPKQPIDAAPKQQQQQQQYSNTPKPNKPSKTPSLNYDGEAWAAWAKSDAEINAKYAKLNEIRNKYAKQGYVGDEAYQKAKDEINGVNQTNAGSNANGSNVMTLANNYMRQGMPLDQALDRARRESSMY